MKINISQTAIEVIQSEAGAINGLQKFINDDFVKTVEAIHHCKGRLIVSGVGKSAIVAQKMVATFNSTGTPALFMHAADAIHGDLGMIQPADIVMLISNSGESAEIKALIPLTKNLGNTLVGMVGNLSSYLAIHSDMVVNATVEVEACPYNLAPTSSTTAQMVMGDALAICLIKLNGFTNEDFARLHPGGNLGKRLYLTVDALYKQNPQPKVNEDTSLKEIINTLSKGRMGAVAVVKADDDTLAGVITEGDVMRKLNITETLTDIAATDILNANPKTIPPSALATQALEMLKQYDINQLIVADGNKFLGFIHFHDLVKEGIG
ncbi:MAG: KpsF/GutQ family sugar-phosphate isomerase [Chitinophagaceae bacterium]|jgi:arabinose-5-phosphate isomerase|nr:KpsF/GutQ family sugar-phosphate isomerase [Chitinophagaceae bacterium]